MTITSDVDWGARSLARDRANRSRAFAGIISLVAGIVFLLAFAWLILAGQFFLIQLPLILGSLTLLIFFGVGYVVNPPVWVGGESLAALRRSGVQQTYCVNQAAAVSLAGPSVFLFA